MAFIQYDIGTKGLIERFPAGSFPYSGTTLKDEDLKEYIFLWRNIMKKIALFLAIALIAGLFAGCTGTTVIINECTCPGNLAHDPQGTEATEPFTEGQLKTGLAIIATPKGEDAAKVEYDVTIVAVLVDENGVIRDCIIDSLGTTVAFGADGVITTDLEAPVLTKNELGYDYNMITYGGAKYEWFEQAQALADYATGKTLEELKNGAIDETGKAPAGSDLAATATIYLGGYVSAIEEAVNNARFLGAQAGDELKLAVISTLASSESATEEAAGLAQLDCDVAVVTVKDGVITSCYIDSLQAKVNFDAAGTITTDLTAPLQTKNQLGAGYNMVAWGGAKAEWSEQAASFASYVTGKTAEEVAGIAVTEGKPADADLAASVTIKVNGFQDLIAKALAE